MYFLCTIRQAHVARLESAFYLCFCSWRHLLFFCERRRRVEYSGSEPRIAESHHRACNCIASHPMEKALPTEIRMHKFCKYLSQSRVDTRRRSEFGIHCVQHQRTPAHCESIDDKETELGLLSGIYRYNASHPPYSEVPWTSSSMRELCTLR